MKPPPTDPDWVMASSMDEGSSMASRPPVEPGSVKTSGEGSGSSAWKPCVVKGLVCDGEWHRGWDGHDPYLARCLRPKPSAEDVVGHKTLRDEDGQLYHEPLTRAEGEKILAAAEAAEAKRAADMPTEKDAIEAMWSAYQRLKELGWNEAIYCPKDGTPFDAIEPGSTGIFRTHYSGEWPKGSWWAEDAGDLWPARPCLYRVTDAERAKWDALRSLAAASDASRPNREINRSLL